ncbi:unnamed protein product [Sphenostylis stenocarpa]|uniref:Thiol-disulfide oxidoreductase DCC n=1 Tax=Sphenostylis stenocarpa TaxID=92480 RepID=A0AA86W0S6_9FABA|nr:unnamed protein product [Sphenostylis stenocarpa]
MAFPLRVATAAAVSRISMPKNPPFISLPQFNCTLKFHNSPFFHPHSNVLPKRSHRHIRAISEATAEAEISKKQQGESSKDWKIKMLYDGDCPLCMREVNMLRERNKSYGTIKFVDIGSDDYSPDDNQSIDYETAMGRIHAILSDGTVVTDVEAFRRLYEHVGLGWVYAITKYEPMAKIADSVYGVWAKYRLQITGRPPIGEILDARTKKGEVCKDSNACKM